MSNPSQALVLKFGTDLADAQKNIANFATNAVANLASIGVKAIEAKKAFDLIASNIGNVKLGLGLLAGFEALTLSIHLVADAAAAAEAELQRLVSIGSGAANAGVGTTFFQSWTQQAKDLNLQTSDLVSMLEKARAAATETIGENGGTAKSPGADRIRQNVLAGNLGASSLASFNGADTQEARIRVVLDLIEQLRQKGAQLAAFDLGKTFFGATFETQLRDGVDMIGKMRTALDGLPSAGGERIVPQGEIENAQRMKGEIEAINDRIARGLKPILDDIHAWQQSELEGMIQLKSYWADIVEIAGQLWKWVDDIASVLNSLGNAQIFKDLNAALDKAGLLSKGDPLVAAAASANLPAITVRGDRSKSLPSLAPAAPKTASTDQVESYINSLKKLTAAEQAEAETLGFGNRAKQEAVDLAKAQEAASERGTPLTAKESEQVKSLADAYVDAKKRIDDYAKQQEAAKASAEFFGQTLEGAVEKLATSGESLKSALIDVVKLLEQAALKALILGEGPLASLFGTAGSGASGTAGLGGLFGQALNSGSGILGGLFGLPKSGLFAGGFADGGSIPAGKWGFAGEAGMEIINGPATVTPIKQINAALNAGSAARDSSIDNSRVFHIDARGAQAGVAEQIMTALKHYDAQLSRNLPARMATAQKRFA